MSSVDTLRRFLFEEKEIRGSIVRLDATWQQLLAAEQYPEPVMKLLGEAAAATALLGRNLKFDGRLTLQIQGAEALRLLVMQSDNNLQLRGLARYGDELPEAFTELVDGGALCVTVESSRKAERYQSIVPLSEINLAECLDIYYQQSVQLPTMFLLEADATQAAGLMLQALPERKPGSGQWRSMVESLQGLDILRMSQVDDEVLLTALFPDEDIRLFDAVPVGFHCDCSEERIDNMLRMLGADELNDLIAQQDPVEICCEFCNRQYLRPAEKIYSLVAELNGGAGQSLH
ncbi:MAG: Hsp33 family molecular chaperone HslO [Gammaproteobacteria bacterium]|nr:Hsp33 family molecular chaperone HslO [Gammaproteobacteria bacterium]